MQTSTHPPVGSGRGWLFLAGLLAVLALALRAGPGRAQEPTPIIPDDAVNAVAKDMYCPVCENTPLDVCPTQACAQWRELIRLKLAEGWTAAQIKEYFAQQYGDRVLAAPPARGLNWLIYGLPPLFIAAGVYLVGRALRGMRADRLPVSPSAGPETAATAAEPLSDDYTRRLEEELKKRA